MVTVIAAVATIIGLIAMIVVKVNFKKAMYNYALPQGDIALFMNEYAESRSNMRGIIGYEDQDLIDSLVERHDMRRESTYERLAAIEETMVTPEGRAAYEEIEKALDAYFEMEAEVIKIGATTDQAASVEELQASMDELTHGLERYAEDMGSAFKKAQECAAALKTADVLNGVVNSVEEIADISKELSDNVTVQVEAVEQANAGINKISEVVESISATAQEAFATSEELSAQAICMDELVAKFQLRD